MPAPKLERFGGVATYGSNSTEITDTTPQEILPAPGAGKALYITTAIVANRNVAESPVINLQDGNASPVIFCGLVATGAVGTQVVNFEPAIEIAANEAVDGVATTAIGDTTVWLYGYIGIPSVPS